MGQEGLVKSLVQVVGKCGGDVRVYRLFIDSQGCLTGVSWQGVRTGACGKVRVRKMSGKVRGKMAVERAGRMISRSSV